MIYGNFYAPFYLILYFNTPFYTKPTKLIRIRLNFSTTKFTKPIDNIGFVCYTHNNENERG